MKISVPALALLLAIGALGADRHKLNIDPESPDGILLQRIEQEPAQPRKLALLEQYAAQFPKTASIAWVYEQLLPIYTEKMEWDRVLATAQALLAADPHDLDSAHDALKAAEAQSNPDLIEKYAELDWDLANKTLQTPKPADPDDAADWQNQMDFARESQAYAEYMLGHLAAAQSDGEKRAAITAALRERNPQSKFLSPSVIELAKLDPAKALQLAEEGLKKNPNNIDFLMTVADHDMKVEKNLPQVLKYSLRILALVHGKPQPDGIAPQEWAKKQAEFTGWANWMAGIIYGKQSLYNLSDKHLRAALPYIHGDARLTAAAYYYLGFDNYILAEELADKGRAIEALKFSKLCEHMDSPYRLLARKNLQALHNDYNLQ